MDGKRSLPYLFVNLLYKTWKKNYSSLNNSFISCQYLVWRQCLCISCKYTNKCYYYYYYFIASILSLELIEEEEEEEIFKHFSFFLSKHSL